MHALHRPEYMHQKIYLTTHSKTGDTLQICSIPKSSFQKRSIMYFRGIAFFFFLNTDNVCCLVVVLGFNATLTAKVISWWSVTHMCFLAFSHQSSHNFFFPQSHRLLFSHASAEVIGENTPDRKFASTGDRTQNYQVVSPTNSPLGGVPKGVLAYILGYLASTTFSVAKRIISRQKVIPCTFQVLNSHTSVIVNGRFCKPRSI